MSNFSRPLRAALAASTVLIGTAVSGCGFENVELNGAVFEAMGVSGPSKPTKEAKVAARPGIVLPPQLDRLPEPGATGSTATAAAPPPTEAWPVDPDERKVADAAELDRKHEAFCREALWKAKAAGHEDAQIRGPKGMCNPSILRNLTGRDITTQ